MKLKDFINVLADIYEINLFDDSEGEVLFRCKSDSKALSNYKDWKITEISMIHSLVGSMGFTVCIKEGSAGNE